jgi:hypothetical protein
MRGDSDQEELISIYRPFAGFSSYSKADRSFRKLIATDLACSFIEQSLRSCLSEGSMKELSPESSRT